VIFNIILILCVIFLKPAAHRRSLSAIRTSKDLSNYIGAHIIILLLSIIVFGGWSFQAFTKKKEKREIVRCLYRCAAKKTSRNESENLNKQNNRKIDLSGNPIIYQYIIIRLYSLLPTYICKVDSNLR